MTLDQVKAASPARGYTRRYGSDSGPWTTNHFIEAVYQSLVQGEVVSAVGWVVDAAGADLWRSRASARCSAAHRSCRRRVAARPPAAADGEGVGADRSHRLLGRLRHRRLALPHGHAGRRATTAACRSRKEALQIVNAWDPAADEAAGNQCKSYGAAAIMRVPGRIHVTWQDDNTLARRHRCRHADAALPVRAVARPRTAKPTWQGESAARWERPAGPRRKSRGAAARDR